VWGSESMEHHETLVSYNKSHCRCGSFHTFNSRDKGRADALSLTGPQNRFPHHFFLALHTRKQN
jgi:hypothetical protein